MKSFSYPENYKRFLSAIILCTRVLCVIFIHYHRVLLERKWIAGADRREFASKATLDDNRRAQRCSLAKIAVGKPGTFIYMDRNLASEDRPTMIAVRKPQLYRLLASAFSNIFSATQRIKSRVFSCILKTRHAEVTGKHITKYLSQFVFVLHYIASFNLFIYFFTCW